MTAQELKTAATRLREKSTAARKDLLASTYYSHDEANFTPGINNAVGGEAGELAATFTPELAEHLADLLDALEYAMQFWAPYREHENGYPLWTAAHAVAKAIDRSEP